MLDMNMACPLLKHEYQDCAVQNFNTACCKATPVLSGVTGNPWFVFPQALSSLG